MNGFAGEEGAIPLRRMPSGAVCEALPVSRRVFCEQPEEIVHGRDFVFTNAEVGLDKGTTHSSRNPGVTPRGGAGVSSPLPGLSLWGQLSPPTVPGNQGSMAGCQPLAVGPMNLHGSGTWGGAVATPRGVRRVYRSRVKPRL